MLVEKKKAVVFGATESAKSIYHKIMETFDIVAFCDNDKNKWGKEIYRIPVISPSQIKHTRWDEVIIISLSAMSAIKEQLIRGGGVPAGSINTSYIDLQIRAREQFVIDFSRLVYRFDIKGNVAEAGVFQGEFASIINKNFSNKKLYLFDTFEGFDERDIQFEEKYKYSEASSGNLNITSEELVIQKMKYPENCIIRKGYFPESAIGVEDSFCFVNLDMDLYKPTLEALYFFWPRMENGGMIVVHDYFSEGYRGVEAAVKEFLKDKEVFPFPIGDSISIAIQKNDYYRRRE